MKITSRIILLCLILLLYIGCAPKLTVMVDGYPMNNNQNYEKNPETELVANYYLSRYYFKNVEKDEEPYLYPESFDLDAKRLTLGDNTKTVCLHVRVTNPKKVYYKTIEKFEILYKREKYPYYVERLLYSEKTYSKALEVKHFLSLK